jgi:transposase
MEQVLDVYAQPLDEDEPLICMDEASKELHDHVQEPVPMGPGQPSRQDDKYERHGTRAVFMFFAPLLGWRRVNASEHRTRIDWAHQIRQLLQDDFPHARQIHLVCDNLNTHHLASLYEAFPAEEAHRLAQRLDLVYTPRNGSWLNVAEIELSVLSRQCLNRRLADGETLQQELNAWNIARNRDASKVTWQFTTDDARTKLAHLYPLL